MEPNGGRYPHGGYIWRYGGCPVHWESRRERHACLSIHEVELRTATEAIRTGLWLKSILFQLGECDSKDPVYLGIDSQSALQTLTNLRTSNKTMRYTMLLDAIREAIDKANLQVFSVKGKSNHADGLTKGLSASEASQAANRLLRNAEPVRPESLNKGAR